MEGLYGVYPFLQNLPKPLVANDKCSSGSGPTEVSIIKLIGGKKEWEGNIMVGGKPVCDDGAKDYGEAVAQVVCRFIFFCAKTNINIFLTISSKRFSIPTIIFL